MATIAGGMHPESFDCDTEYKIPRVYSGVANDLRFYGEGAEANVIALLDLPLSFVLDTVVLPYTLIQQWRFGDLCPGASSEAIDVRDALIRYEEFRKARCAGIQLGSRNNHTL